MCSWKHQSGLKDVSVEIYVFSYGRKDSEAFTLDSEGVCNGADVGDITTADGL